MKIPSRFIRIIVAAIVIFTVVPLLRATTDFWTDGGGGNVFWLNAANWNPAAVPQAGDELVFTNTVGLVNSNNISGGNFKGITFATPSGAFVLNGNDVTLTDNITNLQANTPETINLPIALGGTVNVSIVPNSVLNLNKTISSSGALSVSGSGLVNLLGTNNFTGGLTVVGGGVVAVNADTNLGAGVIVLNGGGIQNLLSFDLKTNRSIALGPTSGSGNGFITTTFNTFLTNGVAMGNNGGGTGGITRLGFGVMRLFGANTYTGSTSNTIGTIVLDFTQPASPVNNIINSSSALTMGGGNAGPTTTNYAQLLMAGTSAGNSQSFAGANFTLGASVIGVTNLAGSGLNTMNLGVLSHDPGSALTLFYSTPGTLAKIGTTSPNVGGILGGWATVAGDAGGPSLPSDNLVTGTNWACVDLSGNIVNFNNYFTINTANSNILLHATVDANTTGVETNILVGDAAGDVLIARTDIDGAGTTTDINSIKFLNTPNGSGVYIGKNNTLRLGQYGGILSVQIANVTPVVGGVSNMVNGISASQAPFGSQNVGDLTAGGPNNNTPGEIVITHSTTQGETTGGLIIASRITDNGSGKVTVIKMGNGSIKIDSDGTYSGGLYMLQGRVQWQGTEIDGTPNGGPGGTNGLNNGAGTGPVYIFPGCYFAPSTSIPNITNDFFVAGAGGANEKFGVFRGGNYGGNVTMVGDATMCSDSANVFGPIHGPFNLTIGAPNRCGNLSLGNSGNDWTGNTTMASRSGFNTLISSNNEVIPNGFGKGNVTMTGAASSIFGWNINGFSETLNGFASSGLNAGALTVSNSFSRPLSTLTIGDNDQSGTFGGIIKSNIALTKIGAGVETFTNANAYSGVTTISNGVLQLTGISTIANSPQVNIFGGTFDVSGASYTIPSTQTINVSGGTLFVSTATGNTAPVNFTNGTLKVASLGSANLTVPTVSLGGALNVIQPAGLPLINTYPTTFPVITYNPLGLSGNTATLAASLPAGGFPPFGGYVSNDNATATIYLVLTNGPVTPLLSWYGSSGGALNSIWDLAVSDWTNKPAHTASSYSDGSLVVFDDSALTNVVSLNIDATPAGITFNNTNVNYTLIGSGGLHGFSTNLFTKTGGGKVTLDNTGVNDLADPVSINGGIVQVGKGDLGGGLGVGSVANNGTIVFNRANSTLTVPNTISGSGDILVSNVPNSTTVLSGNSSFNGNVSVIVSNTVQTANANALGSSNGVTTIANGAALDVNGQSLPEWVTVSGAGVVNGGSTNGAIYNSNPSSAGPPQVRRVTMLGDTVVGAPSGVTTTLSNRLDIRGTGASLSTGGNAYKLTKVGGNQFSISGVTVDPALGDVDVLGGMLSVETSTTGLGNPAANLTMHNNTTLQLYNLAAPLNKQISMGLSGGDNTTINAGSGTGNTIAGSMVLNGPINVNTASGTVLTLSNALSGGQSITKNGTNGTLVISGADNHSGGIVVNDGTLILGSINNNGTSGNQITENPPISGFTLTVGGNGTNAAPMDIEDTLWPGVIGHPATLGVGDGSSTYNDEGAGALQFGEQGNQGKATFSLNTATTVGGGVNDLVLVNGSFTGGGGLVKVNPLTPLASGSVYTLIKYSTAKNGDFSGVGLVSSVPQPSRYAFTLDTTTLGLIKLDVTAGAATLLWNNAQANGVWDLTNNFNWHNTAGGTNDYFAQLDSVTFDDSIGGAGTVVNLTTTNLPYSLTVNSASNYTFNGSGKISGATGITKTGTGTLAINTTNDFTGTIAVYGGTLALNSANTGVSSVLITNGSVLVNDTNALGNTNVTITVTNSGTLDVGGESFGANQIPLLGAHPIFISGWGVNSNGCLINSSTNLTQEDAAQNITMTGDAAIGGVGIINGPGRFDIGRIIPATFSTGGHPYTLTKVGSNQVSFVSVTVDTNLGNIDIKGGELGFETQNATTTSMGNPLSNCVVEAGATLEFFGNNTNVFTKQFIVNGDGVTTNIIMGGSSGTTTLSGNMTLSGTVGIGGSATSITNNAQMSGTGAGVIKSGVVNLVLTTNETYTGNTTISGGTLSLAGNGSINSSPNISMASGTTIDVSARANNALTLASGQTLAAGTGTINGNLTNLVGTISLTGTNGSFTVTSNATFGSSALIANQLDHGSNTVMTVNGIVTYAGTLTVTTNAASTTTLTAGTIYRLFSASSYLGSFSAINLPALDPSLTWDTSQLTNNGTIQVVSNGPAPQPHITSISLSGTTLSFSATNGPAGGQYVLLGSTDVALPLSSWTPIFTNSFDGSGDINLNTNVVNTAVPDQFYIIKLLP